MRLKTQRRSVRIVTTIVVFAVIGSALWYLYNTCYRDESQTIDIPIKPDPYHGGIQLRSGYRIWADFPSHPRSGHLCYAEIRIENRASVDLGGAQFGSGLQIVDDRGNVYPERRQGKDSYDYGQTGIIPVGSHITPQFAFEQPTP